MMYPFGKNWTCVECGTDYPEDTDYNTCPADDGHLHRIAGWGAGEIDPTKKMEYLRMVHSTESRHIGGGRFDVGR